MADVESQPSPSGENNVFPPTAWTLVQQAALPDAVVRDAALNALAVRYRQPIYVYLRIAGRSMSDAEDLTQSFFVHLIEKDLLSRVHLREVRFRAFLRSVLENFLANTARTAQASKRLAGFTLDIDEAEHRLAAYGDITPAAAFDGVWALERLEAAVARLRTELSQAGRAWVADALLARVGWSAETTTASVVELSRQYGINENQLSVALHRARQRLRQLLLEDLARSASGPEEAADELADMFAALGRRAQ